MDKTFLFSIVVALFGICFTLAKGASEVDESISQTERTIYVPVDTAVNKEFRFNGSELEGNRTDECKCKNGKCMRMCDVKKNTPCEDQTMVCVCNPEFGKISDVECKYCDCGQGFNCTFREPFKDLWVKTCICPDGYYFDDFKSSKCKPECSEDRPCQNGGRCGRLSTCNCPWGTKGDLCEEIDCGSKCQNRLEVDCLLNNDKHFVYCSCKNSSLYYDQEVDICKPCQCENGYCDYEFGFSDRRLMCRCPSGYKNFNGYCKECVCGDGADGVCKLNSSGEKICKCRDGFFEREGLCWACGCENWNDRTTKCEVTGNVKRCFCSKGLQDVLGHCNDVNECDTNNTCPPSTTCHNTFGSFYCECPEGYKGTDGLKVKPGGVCEDIDECVESLYPCVYWEKVKCVNLPGSYKCECLRGYEPDNYALDPRQNRCSKTSKNWGPAAIVICTSLVLMGVSYFVHVRVKKRASFQN